MDRLDIALKYLSLGWAVIPVNVPTRTGCTCGRAECQWPGKHPRILWREYTRRLPTVDEVTEWFGDTYYESNIGVVTGQVSGIVVVDVDGPLEEYRKLGMPRTLTSATGGGGRHYIYACDKEVRSRGAMVQGIDLKANGGFVVMPPSVHVSGERYRWLRRMAPVTLDISLIPKHSGAANEDRQWYHELLGGVSKGDRSSSAARLAGRYANLGLATEETHMLMARWNDANDPPLSHSELKSTIMSVYRRHADSLNELVERLVSGD